MSKRAGIVVAAVFALVATLASIVAAVWLTGDPRAAGPVVIVAGVLVSSVIGYAERKAEGKHQTTASDVEPLAREVHLTRAA